MPLSTESERGRKILIRHGPGPPWYRFHDSPADGSISYFLLTAGPFFVGVVTMFRVRQNVYTMRLYQRSTYTVKPKCGGRSRPGQPGRNPQAPPALSDYRRQPSLEGINASKNAGFPLV